MNNKNLVGRRMTIWLAVLAGTVILNILSWKSTVFSDWYTACIFPAVSAPLACFADLFPFSIGEWLLPAAAVWGLVFLAASVFMLVGRFCRECANKVSSYRNEISGRRSRPGNRREASWRRHCRRYRRFAVATLKTAVVVFLIMTLNCVILYHVTPLEKQLKGYGKEYSIEELADLRDEVVSQCNRLAELVPRDADGEVSYAGGYGAMGQKARQAIANEASVDGKKIVVLRRLGGRSVTPKGLLASGFVSQQYMQGYYFPFSMEANYNTVMKIMNVPFTMCHELSHTHGFIYEDEANLIGFLACIHSDDPVFQYSGWLGVLNYVNNSFYENVDQGVYRAHPAISVQVLKDNEFLSEDSWKKVEEKAVVSTETAKAAADAYLDSTLKANGVESGKASYSHVVGLMLAYFDDSF